MERFSFTIPIYEWKVSVFTKVTAEDKSELISYCSDHSIPGPMIQDMLDNIIDRVNTGAHLCDCSTRTAIICYSPLITELDYWDVMTHEIQHLIDHIALTDNIDRELECKAKLTGFIYKQLFMFGVVSSLKSSSDPISSEVTDSKSAFNSFDTFKACLGNIENPSVKRTVILKCKDEFQALLDTKWDSSESTDNGED